MQIHISKHDLILGEIYRIPNSNQQDFQDFIRDVFCGFRGKHTVIGTDQNIDLLKIQTHGPTGRFLDTVLENDFVPTITKPTRVTHQSCTLIDNMYVSADLSPGIKTSVLVEHISDHFPCLMQLDWPHQKITKAKMVSTRKLTESKLFSINNKLLHT